MSIPFPIRRAAVAALMIAITLPSWAADPLTLAEAQRIAVGRSQQLVAQDDLASAARDQAVAAGQLPDPVLKLGIDNLPINGPDRFSLNNDFMTQRSIGLMQEFPSTEKRQLRSERFEREAQRIQAQRQLTLANVQRDTALAWLNRYYSQAQRALMQQQIEESQLQVQAADIAFRGGRGSEADLFAARAAVIGLQDRLSQIEQQSRSAGLALARWVGAAAAERPPAGPPPWQSTPLQGEDLSEHLNQHPDLQVIRAEIDAAETEAQLAQANKHADWSVEASYSQRGPAYSNMVSIQVSIPLQWDQQDRQDREVAAKLALVDEAQARYDDMLHSHEAEVSSLLNDWQTGKDRVARYRNELIPTARQRSEAALTAYRSGKGDLASALSARRDEVDARLQALTVEMDTARSWAQLNYLIPDHNMAMSSQEQP
ncbi:MAG: TolC family protein [Burkholderiales bacterium]|nr:TolC family protein [Burkholderiales bacterium]